MLSAATLCRFPALARPLATAAIIAPNLASSASALSPALFSYHRFHQQKQRTTHWRALAIVTGTVTALLATDQLKSASACGIVGYVGEQPATPILLEGITILQNRGYDSAGIATIRETASDSTELVVTKFASKGSTSDCVELLASSAPQRHLGDRSGIAHTRWATHGGKTDENAHPHCDASGRFALVHNGTIENSSELRHELESFGVEFKSQTDTEVIVQLLGHYCVKEGLPMIEALRTSLKRCEGTYGIVCIDRTQPRQIVAVRLPPLST